MATIGQNGDGGRWVGGVHNAFQLNQQKLSHSSLLSSGQCLGLVPAIIFAISFIDSY